MDYRLSTSSRLTRYPCSSSKCPFVTHEWAHLLPHGIGRRQFRDPWPRSLSTLRRLAVDAIHVTQKSDHLPNFLLVQKTPECRHSGETYSMLNDVEILLLQ